MPRGGLQRHHDGMKSVLQAAASAVTLSEGKDGWYQIMPAGRTERAYDGRGPYVLNDARAVIAASRRPKVDLLVDRDHQLFFAKPGTEVTAAGWIKALDEIAGAIWANIEWTPRAQKQVDAKEYRYLSPVFTHDTDGNVIAIKHVSLTNNPNLELEAIASAQLDHIITPEKTTTQKENAMTLEEFLKALGEALGLEGDVTVEAVLAALAKKDEEDQEDAEVAEASATLTQLRKTLKLAAKADGKAILAAASALVTAKGTATVDPKEFVPMSAFVELRDSLASMQAANAKRDAETAVASAMREGKVTPAQKEWALSYASADPKAFEEYLKTTPRIAVASASFEGTPADADNDAPDAEGTRILGLMGVTPDDLKKQAAKA